MAWQRVWKSVPGGKFLWQIMHPNWALSRSTAKKPVSLYTVHDGAVHTIQRSPFFNDIVLTVGGWNVAIWKEEVMVSSHRAVQVGVSLPLRKTTGTCGCSRILSLPMGHFIEKREQTAWLQLVSRSTGKL